MTKMKILLVDLDEDYITTLLNKFATELDDIVELMVITEQYYLERFFAMPQRVDVLVISEVLYDQSFEKHDIQNTFLLTEYNVDDLTPKQLGVKRIYKYTSVPDIYNVVLNSSKVRRNIEVSETKETKVITLYSPIGGIGKTTIASGICSALAKNYKKVLYVSLDNLQAFGYLFSDVSYLPADIEAKFSAGDENLLQEIRKHIKKELFDILPPFRLSLSSLNITVDKYLYLIEEFRKNNEYDFIIVDAGANFSINISKLMGASNNVFIITGQDSRSVYNIERLLENIDTSDKNKFKFICNKYNSNKTNYFIDGDYENLCHINEYVNYNEEIPNIKTDQLGLIDEMEKIALLCI